MIRMASSLRCGGMKMQALKPCYHSLRRLSTGALCTGNVAVSALAKRNVTGVALQALRTSQGFKTSFTRCVVTFPAYILASQNVRCSSGTLVRDNFDGSAQVEEKDEFPRPQLIGWDQNIVNNVQLIGNVGRDVEIKYLNTGKVLSKCSLAVHKYPLKKDEIPNWFELEFWGTLAEVAAHHVKKGDSLFVVGRLQVDKYLKDEVTYTRVKVVVKDLNFVAKDNSQSIQLGNESDSDGNNTVLNKEKMWENFFSDPSQWWDNRKKKTNLKAPDFKHKSSSKDALWVDSWDKPDWVEQKLLAWDTSKASEGPEDKNEAALQIEKMWQEFFADPSQWWDNRKAKTNPKAPDFKHKTSTKDALWVDSWNNPDWVNQKLGEWDSTKTKAGHVEGAGEDEGKDEDTLRIETLWQNFFSDPSQWWDNRKKKINPKAPDFKHKISTKDALWVDNWKKPDWVEQKLTEWESSKADHGHSEGSAGHDEATLHLEKKWKEFFADPSQWWDNRKKKTNPKSPDFKHKTSTKDVLWVDSWNNPDWLEQKLAEWESTKAQASHGQSEDEATLNTKKNWLEFFGDPSQWWDNRKGKTNPKAPDFRHKVSKESLWVDGWNNPDWVTQKLIEWETPKAKAGARESEGQSSNEAEEESLKTEKMWQEFFTDPSQWWDNRKGKKNPKSPDFKHKSTKESLWVEGWSNPEWVKQQLGVWESTKLKVSGGGWGKGTGNEVGNKRPNSLSSFNDADFF